jgi:hypothetical protein
MSAVLLASGYTPLGLLYAYTGKGNLLATALYNAHHNGHSGAMEGDNHTHHHHPDTTATLGLLAGGVVTGNSHEDGASLGTIDCLINAFNRIMMGSVLEWECIRDIVVHLLRQQLGLATDEQVLRMTLREFANTIHPRRIYFTLCEWSQELPRAVAWGGSDAFSDMPLLDVLRCAVTTPPVFTPVSLDGTPYVSSTLGGIHPQNWHSLETCPWSCAHADDCDADDDTATAPCLVFAPAMCCTHTQYTVPCTTGAEQTKRDMYQSAAVTRHETKQRLDAMLRVLFFAWKGCEQDVGRCSSTTPMSPGTMEPLHVIQLLYTKQFTPLSMYMVELFCHAFSDTNA